MSIWKSISAGILLSAAVFWSGCSQKKELTDEEKAEELFMQLLILSYGDYRIPATITDNPDLPVITAGGEKFHGETFGDSGKDVIIILHGGPGVDYRSLLPLQSLSDAYYVVFYDQRGSGLSPRSWDHSVLTFDQAINDLNSMIETYSPGRKVILFGHSYGGQLAVGYTEKYPERIKALVLAEPGPLTQEMAAIGPVTGQTPDLFLEGFLAILRSLYVNGPDPWAQDDYFISEMAMRANPGYWCKDKIPGKDAFWRFGRKANEVITSSMRDSNGIFNSLVDETDFSLPVLILSGSCNTVIGEEFQKKQSLYFGNVKHQVIGNAGHYLITDQTEESLRAIRDFLLSI